MPRPLTTNATTMARYSLYRFPTSFLVYLVSLNGLTSFVNAIDLQAISGVDNVPGVSLGTVYTNETIKLRWTGSQGTVALLLWATYPDRSGQIGRYHL